MKKYYIIETINELRTSFKKNKIWLHLGWSDIVQRYRGSIIGPFWITFSMVIFIGALSIVYTRLFHQEIKSFIPFLTAGILIWNFISTIVMESADVYINSKPLIESVKLPYFLYIMRLIWKNQIIFAHNFVVFFIVAILFKVPIGFKVIFFIPSFFILSIILFNVSMVLALLGTRFRDIPPVLSSLIMVMFFITPVTWDSSMMGKESLIIKLNPLTYLIDLIRKPLLGQILDMKTWLISILLLVLTGAIGIVLMSRFKRRIPFWV